MKANSTFSTKMGDCTDEKPKEVFEERKCHKNGGRLAMKNPNILVLAEPSRLLDSSANKYCAKIVP